jgi:outer membrane protein assembly factor BamD (BamD/ComL family)
MKGRMLHALLVAAIAAPVALGCGYWVAEKDSVRFNWEKRSAADFARLGPLRPKPAAEVDEPADDLEYDYESCNAKYNRLDAIWQNVDQALEDEDLRAVRDGLEWYLRESYGEDDGVVQERRNAAIDQLDALSALREGAPAAAVVGYLRTSHFGAEPSTRVDRRLTDNYAYLRAARVYRERKYEEAAEQLEALAASYPRSEKRDAAMFVAARARMRLGLPVACCSYYRDEDLPSNERAAVIAERAAARRGFVRLLAEYPRGRFALEARGWLAHLEWERGDRAVALAEYFRLAADPSDEARARGLSSLRIARPKATDDDLRRLEEILAREPRVALAYAYYELYNNGPWILNDVWHGDDEAAAAREKREASFVRVVDFATRMARHAPRGEYGASFLLRAAMANLELGRHEPASLLARQALAAGLGGADREQAVWIGACADLARGALDEAERGFESILRGSPDGPLAEGARCHLAMIAEDRGDLGGALDQYIALGYEVDVTYFVDVLMTPEQLADFLATRPNHPRRDALWYALGVRYLRDGRLAEARAAYARVRTVSGWQDHTYGIFLKSPDGMEEDVAGVRSRWVARDLQTVADLERLRARVDAAPDDEARAEALYQLASYLYEGSCLLFYNPDLWRDRRTDTLKETESAWLRLPGESQVVWAHARAHEPVAQALQIYLDIVDRYPSTRAARDALLTAKFCEDRLSTYNGYWSTAYDMGLHAGHRRVTAGALRATYPDYVWPQAGAATWEPATRTAAGRPGWPPPPRPKPPVPLWRRAADRAWALAVPPAQWLGETLRSTVEGEVRRGRFVTLALAFAVACAALWRAARAALDLTGRRAARAAVWAAISALRRPRAGLVTALGPTTARPFDGALARRTGLAILTYALPGTLALALLLALASRL